MTYRAPVNDILFALRTTAGLPDLISRGIIGVDEETVAAILAEAGKFGTEVLDPLNYVGDTVGSKRAPDGSVTTPPGWKDAYRQFIEAGWSALPCPETYGGQGLGSVVAMAVCEIWNSANMAFGMCPLLTNGAIDSIEIGGSQELKARFLPKLVSGQWSGTMNLTEPQAGSDLNAVATRAERHGDGTYRIFGTKIFISYGEHDLTENIIHLVLARLPDAPPGTRGISLFLVPKRLVDGDGELGAKNDVVCAGLEHKLGIRASPTAVMKFGERGEGAVGYLVGEENRGLHTMFIMMNAARLAVGVQGVAIAERATQRAVAYAQERRQGRAGNAGAGMAPIIAHPDVRRMLLTMKAQTQAARAICLATARETDIAHRASDPAVRQAASDRVALLTPIAKAVATDTACSVSSLGVQVHGGMGFIEETGAAQHFRDARILPIYEGTNGIQAIDLVMRKLPLGGGAVMKAYLGEIAQTVADVKASARSDLGRTAECLGATLASLVKASEWMGRTLPTNAEAALAAATPYLKLFGLAAGGHYLARAALDTEATPDRIALARFYAENIAVAGPGLAECVMNGGASVLAVAPDAFGVGA